MTTAPVVRTVASMMNPSAFRTTPAVASSSTAPPRPARARRAVALGAVTASLLLLAACGGGSSAGSSSSEGASTAGADDAGSPSTTAAPAPDPGAETVDGAKIRIVNLYAPGGEASGPVVVLAGQRASEEPEPIETIDFGEVSDYFAPPAPGGNLSFSLYPEGAYEDGDRLMQVSETMVEGDQATLVLTTAENSEGPTGATQTLFEELGPSSTASANVIDEAPSGQGLVLGNARAVEGLEGTSGGYQFGIPGTGCLEPSDGNKILVGGTATVPFAVDPGPTEIAAYAFDDQECASPVVGPASVDLGAGDRAYVLVYGSGPERDLLVLPVDA